MSAQNRSPSRDSSPEAPGKKKQSPPPRTSPPRTSPPRTSPPRETATATASSRTTASRTGNQAAAAAAAVNLATRRPPVAQLRGPPPQASSAAAGLTYTHAQLESYVNQSHEATEDHIVDAADHIIQVLGGHHISYAIMGGFSLRIRGSERRTFDVDLAVGGNMLQLRTAFAADSRVRIPQGPVAGVMRVFVSTGGSFHPGLDAVPVCVDLICEASLGAPTNIAEASEMVIGETERGPRTYRLLDLKHILEAKLAAFAARKSPNDFTDLLWLLDNYRDNVFTVIGKLPLEHRRALLTALEQERPKRTAANLKRFKHLLRIV